jgi:hypothetical protein
MSNGLLGLNVRTLGVSRDAILSAAWQIGGAWLLIQDDPELVAQAKAAGLRTIYRQSGDETLATDPAVFVQTRAEKGADYVYLTNELDPTPEVLAYTMECMKYADKIGAKCVIENLSTDRTEDTWRSSMDVLTYAIQRDHAVGCHVYLRSGKFVGDNLSFLPIKHQLGGLWLVTEYAFYVDAYNGWRGRLSPAQYGAFLDSTLPLFQREQMPVLLFSGENWKPNEQGKASGFGVLDNAEMLNELVRVNQTFTWSMPMTQPAIPSRADLGTPTIVTVLSVAKSFVNIRAEPNASSARVGTFAAGAVITLRPQKTPVLNGHAWFAVETPAVGWAAADVFTYQVGVVTPEAWTVNLLVPYVNQNDTNADVSFNDCGIASLLMQIRYWCIQHGLKTPSLPTVDDLEKYTPLALPNPPHGLTFADIATLAGKLGFATQYIQPISMADITRYLDADKPVMCLLDYSVYSPGAAKIAHLLIVKGYSDTDFNTADPYLRGDNVRISKAQLSAAMASSPGNALGFQALILTS